jgi:hypothetical protein
MVRNAVSDIVELAAIGSFIAMVGLWALAAGLS